MPARTIALPLLLAATSLVAAETPDLAQRCAALAGRELGSGSARVADAALVAAEEGRTASCVARVAVADSALRFELRLPTSGWNGKLVAIGGGGFDGIIATGAEPYISASATRGGYASFATNGGHDAEVPPGLAYFAATFAADAQQLADFTWASEHRALPLAQELVAAYYGNAPKRSYFEGCSMGGHDALIEAQRFPHDFDGIVARAPAGNVMGLFLKFHQLAQLARAPGAALDAPRQQALAAAVLARCDALDGAKDGLIARPMDCAFDPATLACGTSGAVAETCLSEAQLGFVRAITSPLATRDGAWSHPGFAFGGEDSPKGWGEYIHPSPALGGSTLQGLFSDGFLRAFITREPAFDTATFDADAWKASLSLVGSMFSATDANLEAFASAGGKLLLWTGTTDSSVSPLDTIAYHDRVVQSLGAERAARHVELFLAAGVGHCFGGAGPDQVDLLAALDRWVESGTAPSAQQLEHRKLDEAGNTVMSRPLCKYPTYPKHDGKGPLAEAKSFACAMP